MAIKSSTFGHTELSGKDAERFVKNMGKTKPNPVANKYLKEGRKILALMEKWQERNSNLHR